MFCILYNTLHVAPFAKFHYYTQHPPLKKKKREGGKINKSYAVLTLRCQFPAESSTVKLTQRTNPANLKPPSLILFYPLN